ncbi:putative phage abortive infection protein [Variovorax sp. NFACC27]|uniref:putative phage abortive infection protein n=1 Tax=unclassified Variovorax TaxID=663243 RepID=UPI0015A25A6D
MDLIRPSLAFVGVAIAANFQFRSNRQAHIQAFETSFYSAIDLLHRISEGLRFDPRIFPNVDLNELRRLAGLPPVRAASDPVVEGRAVFAEVARCIKSISQTPQQTLANYRKLQNQHNYVLGHYFRHLYQALKMIDRQPDDVLSHVQKQTYASILRAQLSTSELALLLLNCSEDVVDAGQFRNLLVRYRFLEHLPFILFANVYVASESGLRISSREGMRSFLTEQPIPPGNTRYQGAFGQNPTEVVR